MKLAKAIREKRFWFILPFEIGLISLSLLLAFLLRFDMQMSRGNLEIYLEILLPLLMVKLAVFSIMGLNHGWWRYVSLADVIDIFKANVIASLLFLLYLVISYNMHRMPRSVLILDFTFCFLLACGIRFITRAYRENYLLAPGLGGGKLSRTLVVGAGCAGQVIVREIHQNPALGKTVIGYIDDDASKLDQRFNGAQVLGMRDDIGRVCEEEKVDEIIIAIPSASGGELRPIVERCRETGVPFKTLPGVGELIDGTVTLKHAREVDVSDLLGRKQVRLEIDKIRDFLSGKRVLVTGAAGSIGSEICRQVARFGPSGMVLLESAETPLFFIEKELLERFPDLQLMAVIGNIRDKMRIETIFREYRPEVVFHAAAYKHVPMMEANPTAAACNNVRGTRIVADASRDFGVRSFVMISTDKAVNPTNVMGATKRAAEIYVQNLARYSRTRFVTVRFGNVLGSNGSVVPIFNEQIRKGGPVRVTHPEVMRYFMTIPEASRLVLQAGSMGQGGEIFLLDMGEPVKIVRLAEELIRLSGFRPYDDIDIVFTGLRPGEKLFEELLLAGEGVAPTSHEKIKVAKSAYFDWNTLNMQIELLIEAAENLDLDGVINFLEDIVPEYRSRLKRAIPRRDHGEHDLGEGDVPAGKKIVFGIRELPKPKGKGVLYYRFVGNGNEMFLDYLDLADTDEREIEKQLNRVLRRMLSHEPFADKGVCMPLAGYETENMQPWFEGVLKRIALSLPEKEAPAESCPQPAAGARG
jgi:FlaA1/EpsC-like NDP-sugar epimerase